MRCVTLLTASDAVRSWRQIVRSTDRLLNCARLKANPLRDGDAKPPVLRIDIDRKIAGLPATLTHDSVTVIPATSKRSIRFD
jgi:hypothetical protein